MEFTLMYEGKLPSGDKANRDDKHRIRLAFHSQLKTLWTLPPLSYCSSYKEEEVAGIEERYQDEPDPGTFDFGSLPYVVTDTNGFKFVSLVHKSLAIVAELDVRFLFPSPEIISPVSMVTRDVDNKLKTLFDGLRIPQQRQEIPEKWMPDAEQNPLFCLLEDDGLIAKVSVSSGYSLRPLAPEEVFVIMNVKVKGKMGTLHNFPLIG